MPARRFRSNIYFDSLVYLAAFTILAIALTLLLPLVREGWGEFSWNYFLSEPRKSGRAGGILSILVANALIVVLCLSVALPLGLATAIYLNEYSGRHIKMGSFIRTCIDILAGVPSIVFGLFGNALFCKVLGLGFSIASGGLTLACMILPILVRTIEQGLYEIPKDYRLGATSLGLNRLAILIHVLLPCAFPSALIGIILGLGRAFSETAALIFTSGYVDRMPSSILDSGRSISVHIYDLAMNVAGGDARAYAASLSLLILLFTINALASCLNEFWLKERTTP